MFSHRLFAILVCASALIGAAAGAAEVGATGGGQLSKADAQRIALAKVPGGTIESAKLEKEGSSNFWSVDVKMPNSRNITEVHIEAKSGRVISVEVETPAQQAAESAADKKAKQ